MPAYPYVAAESVGGPESHDPYYLTPNEHELLIAQAMREFVPFSLSDAFQDAVVPRDPDALLSLFAIYPGQRDACSALRRKGVELLSRYNFMVKDGDPLPDYKEHIQREFLVIDNRFDYRVPVGAIVTESRTPGREPSSLIALKENWGLDPAGVSAASREPDGDPLPDLLCPEVQDRMWDVSLISILPSHQGGGEYDIPGFGVQNILYNAVLRAAEAEGVDRFIATIDVKLLKVLQKFGGHWHALEGVTPKPYRSYVKDADGNPSNLSVVATVNVRKWREDMERRRPAAAKMLWGYSLQNRSVEYVGLQSPNLYDVMPKNPNLSPSAIDKLGLQTPALVMDLGDVEKRYGELTAAFPDGRIHYATKANFDPRLLTWLQALGSRFEVASAAELKLLQSLGVDPREVLFTHPVKRPEDIAYAHQVGLDRFAFSSLNELYKIRDNAPGARVIARLSTGATQSAVPSEGKFGRSPERVAELMLAAGALGLTPYGIAFHVGSQMERTGAWLRALRSCAEVMELMDDEGVRITALDIGGGLPGGFHRAGLPPYKDYAFEIKRGVKLLPYPLKEFILEPGRALAGDGVIVTTVLDVIRDGEIAQVYTDLGAFVLLEALQTGHKLQYPVTDSKQSPRRMRANMWAGSCDGADLIMKDTTALSANLEPGDKAYLYSTGAYSTVYASDFNGLPKPSVHLVGPGRNT